MAGKIKHRLKLRFPESSKPPQPQPARSPTGITSVGKLVIGKEELECNVLDLEEDIELGRGAYGAVYQMKHKPTGIIMAVKRIRARVDKTLYEKDLKNYMESKDCPYTITLYGALHKEGDIWFCMELMDSSMDKISEKVYKVLKKRIPEEVLGMMTVAVIKALTYLESELSVVHSDVQPSHILINKIGDFKLHFRDHPVDEYYESIRLRIYQAPETIDPMQAQSGYTSQADVWSFGITLMELALGCFPYGRWENFFEQLKDVLHGPSPKLPEDGRFSKMMQEFTSACLTKDTTARPNYHDLQRYKFFRTYYMAEVDVGMWLKTVMDAALEKMHTEFL